MAGKKAVIVDLDGTLVDTSSIVPLLAQRPKQFDEFHIQGEFCPPNAEVLDKVHLWDFEGYTILIVTGREQRWEAATKRWLAEHLDLPYIGPYMRTTGDHRPAPEVKDELLLLLQAEGWDIRYAIDDDPRIVALWTRHGISTQLVPGWQKSE